MSSFEEEKHDFCLVRMQFLIWWVFWYGEFVIPVIWAIFRSQEWGTPLTCPWDGVESELQAEGVPFQLLHLLWYETGMKFWHRWRDWKQWALHEPKFWPEVTGMPTPAQASLHSLINWNGTSGLRQESPLLPSGRSRWCPIFWWQIHPYF